MDLAKAAVAALRDGHEVEVDFYGDDAVEPDYADHIRRLIAEAGQERVIRLHPYNPDVGPLLRASDVSVVTSISEAFGRVTVESLHCNIPVIGYDVAGTREILQRGGGVLVTPNPEDLRHEIARLCTAPGALQALKDAAARAGEQWRAARPEDEVLDVIEEVVRRRP